MKYGNEGMDCKKYFLLFLQKSWIALLAAVIGAALGGGIYLFVHVVIDSNREYQAQSKVYLDFAPDESGEIYQEYNGYTWNDLMATTLILDTTMSYLPDDYTEEEVVAATSAQILSDLRLLTITITTSAPDRTAEILAAMDRSLVELGKREKEFIDIEIIQETEPKLLAADPRLLQAVLLGGVIALAGALLAMALVYVLNDKIYVPSDLKSVTNLPFAGFLLAENMEGKEAEKHSSAKTYAGVDQGNGIEQNNSIEQSNSKAAAEKKKCKEQKLLTKLQADCKQNQSYLTEKYGTLATLEIDQESQPTDKTFATLRNAGGILLVLPYGKMDRTTLSYRIEQLTLQECRVAGILIKDADMRFMKWYYNHL